MCKGKGIYRAREDFPYQLFSVNSWEELIRLLGDARRQMPQIPSTDAIFNALNYAYGFARWGTSIEPKYLGDLVDRRATFASLKEVSLRTVMRLEEQGAVMLDNYIERLTRPLSTSELYDEYLVATLALRRVLERSPVRTAELFAAWNRFDDEVEALMPKNADL